jgi:hypothetical protein
MAEGVTAVAIADHLARSPQAVRNFATRHGMQFRLLLSREQKRDNALARERRKRKMPHVRLRTRIRHMMRNSLRRRHLGGCYWEHLGYSRDDLKTHLERQFIRGMSWENMDKWHIDHILPINSFGPMELGDAAFKACWALSNLRPLWKRDNLRKGHKVLHLL